MNVIVAVLLFASLVVTGWGTVITGRKPIRKSASPGLYDFDSDDPDTTTWWSRSGGTTLLSVGLVLNTVAGLLTLLP